MHSIKFTMMPLFYVSSNNISTNTMCKNNYVCTIGPLYDWRTVKTKIQLSFVNIWILIMSFSTFLSTSV